jgi:CHASE3 domain sensor protein
MLQNPPVRSKLIAILALPVLVMVLLVFSRTNQNVNQGREADRLTGLTNFMDKSLDLTSQLQKERDLATGYLASDRRGGRDRLFTQQARVDRVAAEYRAEVAKLDFADYRDRVRKHAVNVDRRLSELAGQRAAMDKPNVAMTRPLDYYTDTIGELLDLEKQVPLEYTERQSSLGNASLELVQNMNNLVRLSRGKEAVASERSLMYALLVHQAVAPDAPTGMSPGQDRDRLTAAVSAGASWLKEFQAFATPEQRGVFARTVTGFGVERSAQLRQAALRLPNRLDLSASPDEWLTASNAKVDRLRGVEQELTFSLLRSIEAARKATNTSTVTGSGLIMLVLFVSVGISLSMSQSMVQSLKRLKESAQELVEHRLPTVVERLKQLERTEEVDLEPEEVPPAVVAGNEIGEVATAFSAVHHVAVQVATEQAALRKSVGDMFLNFARRNQVLIDRQLELIEDLEGRETNQAQREEFLRLDRLATSMRRNAEDLIVLSGATPPRRWSEPVPLPEVMQAALSEVEDYRRVELVRLDELAIVGEAASDVAHILAELIENATSFSPPQTMVHVAGQTVTTGYVIEVEDRASACPTPSWWRSTSAWSTRRASTPPCRSASACSWSPGWPPATASRSSCGTPGTRASPRWSCCPTRWSSWPTATPCSPRPWPGVSPRRCARRWPRPRRWLRPRRPRRARRPGHRGAATRRSGCPSSRRPGPTGFGAAPPDSMQVPMPPPATAAGGAPVGADEAAVGPLGPPLGPPPRTDAGLPLRVPRARLAPGLSRAAGRGDGEAEQTSASSPDADEIRQRLSSYQQGFERGRQEVSGTDADGEQGPETPGDAGVTGAGGTDPSSASRS